MLIDHSPIFHNVHMICSIAQTHCHSIIFLFLFFVLVFFNFSPPLSLSSTHSHLYWCFSLNWIIFQRSMQIHLYKYTYIPMNLSTVCFCWHTRILSLVHLFTFQLPFRFRESYWDRKVHFKIAHMPPICFGAARHTIYPLFRWVKEKERRVRMRVKMNEICILGCCVIRFNAITCCSHELLSWLQNAIQKWKINYRHMHATIK